MATKVLDSWALMALFNEEPASEAVEKLLHGATAGKHTLLLSVINWGEIYYTTLRCGGQSAATSISDDISQMPITLVPVETDNLELARQAAKIMSMSDFSAAMVETHHSAKKDAPSGTAIAIVKAMEGALGKQLPVTSVRTGSVPGTHELIFDAAFEQITLRHEARDRRVFADGALRAAEWLKGKKGVFTMRDVLGFSDKMGGAAQ